MNENRPSPSHGRGHRFDPCRAHHQNQHFQALSEDRDEAARQHSAEHSEKIASPDGENPGDLFTARSLIDSLLAHAFGHSDTAARQARKIAVALQQWPNKTEAGKAHERKKIREDMLALSAMMRGQA